MKCFGFKVYLEEKDIVPSDLYKIDIDEDKIDQDILNDLIQLEEENVVSIFYEEDKEVWFYSYSYENLKIYIQGMTFAITNLMDGQIFNHTVTVPAQWLRN